jgi:hypothetical protein
MFGSVRGITVFVGDGDSETWRDIPRYVGAIDFKRPCSASKYDAVQ